MITTIQLNENVKNELESMKISPKDTYEDVILNLMRISEKHKREQKKLLIEGYKEMAKTSLEVTKEFESIEKSWD